jgi:hypothetical protein
MIRPARVRGLKPAKKASGGGQTCKTLSLVQITHLASLLCAGDQCSTYVAPRPGREPQKMCEASGGMRAEPAAVDALPHWFAGGGHARRRGVLLRDAWLADWESPVRRKHSPDVCACPPTGSSASRAFSIRSSFATRLQRPRWRCRRETAHPAIGRGPPLPVGLAGGFV